MLRLGNSTFDLLVFKCYDIINNEMNNIIYNKKENITCEFKYNKMYNRGYGKNGIQNKNR